MPLLKEKMELYPSTVIVASVAVFAWRPVPTPQEYLTGKILACQKKLLRNLIHAKQVCRKKWAQWVNVIFVQTWFVKASCLIVLVLAPTVCFSLAILMKTL